MRRADWWGAEAGPRIQLIRALGRREGVELDVEGARPVHSFDAHRLLQLGRAEGKGSDVSRALLHAYHSDVRNIADRDVLVDIGATAGLSGHDVVAKLRSDRFPDVVASDQQLGRRLGVRGVPSILVPGHPLQSAVQPVDDLRWLLVTRDSSVSARHETRSR